LCSRYTLTSLSEAVRDLFGLPGSEDFPARYNIAPAQPVAIVRHGARRQRELQLVQWGLIPSWLRDPRAFKPLINARSETAAEKPSFRGAMRHRRCLIPATGYYEWTGRRGAKQPHLIQLRGHELFAMAGLWEAWLGADGSEIETMAVLTTAANGDVAAIHDRMPVVLGSRDYERWLDCSSGSASGIGDLLKPLPEGCVSVTAVNPKLNHPDAEGPDLHLAAIPTLL
jgi:putative SOS response-associated peptidase YedK